MGRPAGADHLIDGAALAAVETVLGVAVVHLEAFFTDHLAALVAHVAQKGVVDLEDVPIRADDHDEILDAVKNGFHLQRALLQETLFGLESLPE
jgi:hypothetical protein